MGVAATGNGLRLRHDVLATIAGLAGCRCVATTARTAARGVERPEKIDWSRAIIDSALIRAMCGGPKTGPNPTDRRKPGSKHQIATDRNGIPLVAILSAANVNDVKELIPLIDHIPPISGKRGRPRQRPDLSKPTRHTTPSTIERRCANAALSP